MKSYVKDWYWRWVCIKCRRVQNNIVSELARKHSRPPELCGGCGEIHSMMLRPTRETHHSFFWFWNDNYSTWEVKDVEDSDEDSR